MHLGGCKFVYVVSTFFGPLPTSGVFDLDPKLSQEVVGRAYTHEGSWQLKFARNLSPKFQVLNHWGV